MAARKARRTTRAAPLARSRKKKTPTPRKKPSTRTRAAGRQIERRRNKQETLRLRSIEPSFTVSNLERSVHFYSDVLGFVVGERFTDSHGVLQGVRLKAGICSTALPNLRSRCGAYTASITAMISSNLVVLSVCNTA